MGFKQKISGIERAAATLRELEIHEQQQQSRAAAERKCISYYRNPPWPLMINKTFQIYIMHQTFHFFLFELNVWKDSYGVKNGVLSVCLLFSVLLGRAFKSKASLIVCFLIVNPEFMHYLWLISTVWIWRRSATMLSEKRAFDKDIWDCIFCKSCWAPSLFFLGLFSSHLSQADRVSFIFLDKREKAVHFYFPPTKEF